jgi:hypothetical protein
MTSNLNSGNVFKGALSITGGDNNDIEFWVTDPEGRTILDLGRVSQGTSFDFTASKNGAYTFHFDNRFSIVSSKVVTFSFTVESPSLVSSYSYILVGLLVMVLILLIFVGIHFYSHRKKQSSARAY